MLEKDIIMEKNYILDLLNANMIKSHLIENFPKILLFYYYEDNNISNINKEIGIITINRYNI